MNKKSILAETLADIQEIREGIEKNANHVLKSTLKDDLEAIVRKGLNESEEEDFTQTDDIAGDIPADHESGEEGSEEMTDGGIEDLGLDIDGAGGDIEIGAETEPGEPEVIDLTDKTDDEVIQHFNLMKPADEIEIIQTPENGIQINIKSADAGEGEFELPGEEGGEETGEPEFDATEEPTDDVPAADDDTEESGEETTDDDTEETEGGEDEEEKVYEIEISETEEPTDESTTSMKHSEKHMKNVDEDEVVDEDVKHVKTKAHMKHASTQDKQYTEELQESLVKTRKKIQSLMTENKNKTEELSAMTALIEGFKGQDAEYKLAIKNLKGYLQEAALYTSNLSYIVKLLSENTTTKDEKLSIIKRFDSAKTMVESREIFNSLETLLNESKKSPEKTITEQVLKTPKTSGSSKLNESTAYKSPQLERMKDLIKQIK